MGASSKQAKRAEKAQVPPPQDMGKKKKKEADVTHRDENFCLGWLLLELLTVQAEWQQSRMKET